MVRKLLILFVCVGTLAIASCSALVALAGVAIGLEAIDDARGHDPAFVPDGWKTHSSSEYDYGIAYPPGWEYYPCDSAECDQFLLDDDSDYTAVQVTPGKAYSGSALSYARNELPGDWADTLAATGERMQLDQGEALVAADRVGDTDYLTAALVVRGNARVIHLSTRAGRGEEFRPIFIEMLRSFRPD